MATSRLPGLGLKRFSAGLIPFSRDEPADSECWQRATVRAAQSTSTTSTRKSWTPSGRHSSRNTGLAPNGTAWNSVWRQTLTGTNPVVRIQSERGELWCSTNCGNSSLVADVSDYSASNVDLTVKVRFENNNSRGGLFARRIGTSQYLAVKVGASGTSYDVLKLYAVNGATTTTLGTAASLTQHADYWLQLVVQTDPTDGSTLLKTR